MPSSSKKTPETRPGNNRSKARTRGPALLRLVRATLRALLLASLLVSPLSFAAGKLQATETPARLTLVPDAGVILLDRDTLQLTETTELELAPGEHLLKFFPYHTAGVWMNRYLVYPFSIGPDGRRMIDLTGRRAMMIRTEPAGSRIIYRGKALGQTPGEYLFLMEPGDSILLEHDGYQPRALRIDQLTDADSDLFFAMQPLDPSLLSQDLQSYQLPSVWSRVLSWDMMLSLGTGAALLAGGTYFNQQADSYYDDYLHLIGSEAREAAYAQARRNDRISRLTFIAGETSLGVCGYLLIRRLIFDGDSPLGDPPHHPKRLSVVAEPGRGGLSLSF